MDLVWHRKISKNMYWSTCRIFGVRLPEFWPCHIVFLIKLDPEKYLKVTNVDRNEPKGFYRNSKLTNFSEYRNIWSFFEPDFRINIFKTPCFE